jgi:hypothetical protein
VCYVYVRCGGGFFFKPRDQQGAKAREVEPLLTSTREQIRSLAQKRQSAPRTTTELTCSREGIGNSDQGDLWAYSVEIQVFATPIGSMLTSFGFPLLNWGIFYKFLQDDR